MNDGITAWACEKIPGIEQNNRDFLTGLCCKTIFHISGFYHSDPYFTLIFKSRHTVVCCVVKTAGASHCVYIDRKKEKAILIPA